MRRVARELLFKLIFEYTFYDCENENTLDLMLQESDLDEEDKVFMKESYHGIVGGREDIENMFKPYLKGYTIDRLYRPDYVSLMLACYELSKKETPVPVVINEAISLSKKYGTDKSGRFVNGVLASVVKNLK